MKADRVYKNRDDTRRARVYKHASGEGWDFDLFKKHAFGGGWSIEAGWLTTGGESPARTRSDAIGWLQDLIGDATEIDADPVTRGWPEKEPPKPTKDAGVEIREGQIWRHGTRKLIVDWVKPHWKDADALEVGCHFIQASGREVGTMIVGRRSARQSYVEQRFREKFRFVREPEKEES